MRRIGAPLGTKHLAEVDEAGGVATRRHDVRPEALVGMDPDCRGAGVLGVSRISARSIDDDRAQMRSRVRTRATTTNVRLATR
jgi:hypothetical protein